MSSWNYRDSCYTRGELLGDDSPRRTRLCTTFASGPEVVPVVAHVLTRVAPVLREIKA